MKKFQIDNDQIWPVMHKIRKSPISAETQLPYQPHAENAARLNEPLII